jgi:hypothetical protein
LVEAARTHANQLGGTASGGGFARTYLIGHELA